MTTDNSRVGPTPGPWVVKVAFGRRGFNIMTPPVGGRTFRLFTSDHATADDALLAAAAPELLAIAERILERGYVSEHIGEEREDYHALIAAIAKARGQS